MSMPCAARASVTVLGSPAAPFLGLEKEPWWRCIDVLPLSVAVTDPCVDKEGTDVFPPAVRRSDGCLVMDETGRSVNADQDEQPINIKANVRNTQFRGRVKPPTPQYDYFLSKL